MDIVSGVFYVNCNPVHSHGWWAALLAVVLYQIFFIILPRIRDLEMSAWWILLIFVPLADIVLGLILLFRAPVYPRKDSVGARNAETAC